MRIRQELRAGHASAEKAVVKLNLGRLQENSCKKPEKEANQVETRRKISYQKFLVSLTNIYSALHLLCVQLEFFSAFISCFRHYPRIITMDRESESEEYQSSDGQSDFEDL